MGEALEGVVKRPLIPAMDGVAEFERRKRLNSGGSEHRDVRHDPAKVGKPAFATTSLAANYAVCASEHSRVKPLAQGSPRFLSAAIGAPCEVANG